jgi:hypothetical protein
MNNNNKYNTHYHTNTKGVFFYKFNKMMAKIKINKVKCAFEECNKFLSPSRKAYHCRCCSDSCEQKLQRREKAKLEGRVIISESRSQIMDWNKLIFDKYNIKTVLQIVKNNDWQKIRKSMLKTSLEFKYKTLKQWLIYNDYSFDSKVQVTNYVNALKRGGLIK